MAIPTEQHAAIRSRFPRVVLITAVSIVLLVLSYCGFRVHVLSGRQERIMKDYSLVHNVSFGLLSVDHWRDAIVSAATYQIEQFKLTPEQQADLKKEIDQLLHALIDKAFAEMNKPQKSLGGKIKKLAFNALVSKKNLQADVPGYSQKILDEINKPSSYRRLKDVAITELNKMGKQTYDSSMNAERSLLDSMYHKYQATDNSSFENKTLAALSRIRNQTYSYVFGMLGCILLILGSWWLLRKRSELDTAFYILSILAALILLAVGLTTTMIEIDARIQSMDFHLLGQSISFKNQSLFFQSKSIVDVVVLLIKTGKVDSSIVGILILCFSILFPVSKLLATGIYLLDQERWSKNRIIRYFAFESGKWSMADVMVVAILMTFIGFNGIVNNELSDLNLHTESITSITTNNTSIQPGYIIFIGFVLFGFVLSSLLKRITRQQENISNEKVSA